MARAPRRPRGREPAHRRDRDREGCLLYTSDAADERSSVDLGGRRIITKKKIGSVQRLSHRVITQRTSDYANEDHNKTIDKRTPHTR